MMSLNFSKKQLRAMTWWCKNSSDYNFDALICDGAVRSGKTLCMGIGFIMWALNSFNNGNFGLCGKTIRSIWRNLIVTLLPAIKNGGYNVKILKSENRLIISNKNKKANFFIFGGKDESSCMLIQGITLCGVFFDEVALMPRSFVEQAIARCSVENSKFWFNCNPQSPAHWFYHEWIKNSVSKNALYLHFTMDDNPSLSEKIKTRYRNLYTGTFYERFILGRWVASEGLIYPFMSNEKIYSMSCPDCFQEYAVSCDYGTRNPSSFGLWGKSDKIWYRIDEYYYDGRINESRTDEEHYCALESLCGEREIRYIAVDPSAASFMEVIKKHNRYNVIKANNDVIQGIRKTSLALKQGKIRICSCCKDTIKEFSLYRWQENNEQPIKENDHAMDDIRYFVTSVMERPSGGWAVAIHR